MSEYMFGITKTEPSQKVYDQLDAICKEEGGFGFTWLDIPGNRIGWFSGPNLGSPFDEDLARRVLTRCENKGIWPVPDVQDERY